MKRISLLVVCLFCFAYCIGQTIVNPVFDRSDTPSFRVEKVKITSDTTYVYCLYYAEENSWANISKETFIEDLTTGVKSAVLKTTGLPYGPEKRHFVQKDTIQVLMHFPHIETKKFNLIEEENNRSFNIYGIDLNQTFAYSYTSKDIESFFYLSQAEEEKGNWQTAINYSLKQLEASDYVEGIKSFPSVCAIYNLIQGFMGAKRYHEAIHWGKKAIEIISTLPKDTIILDVLARTYGNMGTAYRLLKQTDQASNYEELSLAIRRHGDGIGTLNYDEYLTHLATQYYREGNFPKALLYGREVVNIYKAKYENNKFEYGCIYLETLCNLCEFYKAMEYVKESISCGLKALELFNDRVCNDDIELKFWIYNNLAAALASNNQNNEALRYLHEILDYGNNDQILPQTINSDKNELLINTRSLIASIYLHNKDTIKAEKAYEDILTISENHLVALEKLYEINRWKNHDKAMNYLKKAIEVESKRRGVESMSYADLLLKWIRNTWVSALTKKEELDSLMTNIHTVVDIIKRHIRNTSFNLSKNDRKAYWQRYHEVFTWLIPTISGILNTQAGNTMAYDASLFYKGLLLSSEKDFKEIIEEENDKALTTLYCNYVANMSVLEKLYEHKSSSISIDSLKNIIKEQEYLLCQKVTRMNKQFKSTNTSWKEVKAALNEHDAAIEIISYRNLRGDDVIYDAYVIGKDSDAPKLFHLCGENELKECLSADVVDYTTMSILILGNENLVKELKKYKTLIISPAGLMNSIGIEYLPIAGSRCLSDKFNVYRVSSTREICTPHDSIKTESACIFGGLDYDNEVQEAEEQKRGSAKVSREVEMAIISRGGFEPLYGSTTEVEMIDDIMKRKGIKTISLYKGVYGNEQSFKQLSRSQINILHISTHGMFVSSDNTMPMINNLNFILEKNDSVFDEETKSLTHSFLVMSGGNKLLNRNITHDQKEDDILTSLEISHLDFKNLDLVVLSACQTALGEIGADGVYGLQRGFKKAGANTIVMSLDKVDDEATQILMVEFYRNLMDGKSKLQSLREAQKHLRSVDNGKYDDPKYWASFIMLDGLN